MSASAKTKRRTLYAASVLLAAGAAGVAGWGWVTGATPSRIDLAAIANTAKPTLPAQTDLVSTSQQIDWARPLQSGFREPVQPQMPPAAPLVVTPKIAPSPRKIQPAAVPILGLRLIGTVVEAGRSLAIASDAQGQLDFRGVGDSFQLEPSGVKLVSIASDSVTVSVDGESTTWRLGEPLAATRSSIDAMLDKQSATPEPRPPVSPLNLEEELRRLNGKSN